MMYELDALNHSFKSLDSEPPGDALAFTQDAVNRENKFSWSRIQQTLGREPPKPALTVFDQPLYRPGIMETSRQARSHVPHDVFLSAIPRLPFPLISLPEAAMLQHFRRERGEEDHTEPSGSFISRNRNGTMSTMASSFRPDTPLAAQSEHSDSASPPLPPPVHCFDAPCRHRTSEYVTRIGVSPSLTPCSR